MPGRSTTRRARTRLHNAAIRSSRRCVILHYSAADGLSDLRSHEANTWMCCLVPSTATLRSPKRPGRAQKSGTDNTPISICTSRNNPRTPDRGPVSITRPPCVLPLCCMYRLHDRVPPTRFAIRRRSQGSGNKHMAQTMYTSSRARFPKLPSDAREPVSPALRLRLQNKSSPDMPLSS